jgi:hypothetical protein
LGAEERVRRLEDALSVEAELPPKHDRLDEGRHARIDAVLQRLGEAQSITQSVLGKLIEQIDRLWCGYPGNGDE